MKFERLATVYDEMVEDEDLARVDPFEPRSLSRDDKALKKALELATGNIEMEREYQYSKNGAQDQRTAIVNIGGREFRTKFSNFLKYPDSRLGRICHATHLNEVQSLCDGFIPGPVPVLFFDRNPQHFGTILDVYRKEEVHVCEMHCSLVVQNEFKYWGLEQILLQPCCSLKYYPETYRANIELDEDNKEKKLFDEREKDENFGTDCRGRFRSMVWDFLEYPETSKWSQVFHSASIFFIFLSTATFLLESSKEIDEESLEHKGIIMKILTLVDVSCIIFFTTEFIMRFCFCPNKYRQGSINVACNTNQI